MKMHFEDFDKAKNWVIDHNFQIYCELNIDPREYRDVVIVALPAPGKPIVAYNLVADNNDEIDLLAGDV